MIKTYVITFDDPIKNLKPICTQLDEMGVKVESLQNFIGTAIIEATAEQALDIEKISGVKAISEAVTMKVTN